MKSWKVSLMLGLLAGVAISVVSLGSQKAVAAPDCAGCYSEYRACKTRCGTNLACSEQ